VTLILALLALLLVLVVVVLSVQLSGAQRRQREGAPGTIHETLRQALRDELEGVRGESRSAARELREELSAQFRGFEETWLTASAEAQRGRLSLGDALEGRLAARAKGVDDRLDAMGQALAQGLERIGDLAGARQAALQELLDARLGEARREAREQGRALREETLRSLGENLAASVARLGDVQRERLEQVTAGIAELARTNEGLQERLRATVQERLEALRQDNADKLDRIRQTVDEQLQGTLEKRLGESFRLVSERLEQVHQGLGEMQALATGVGDLRRMLTNVKIRGTWGEVQLGSLLEQMLTPEQYVRGPQTKPDSPERVEYAVRLPGRGDEASEVLLPIGATFPNEDYDRVVAASERADRSGVEAAGQKLEQRIRATAKDLGERHIHPPYTTDFAILFLPTEGLYADVLRRPGVVDRMQREFRVTLAGPTTLGAMLNALQMGFRTLAIQKRSSEVWVLLEAVKTEFGKYGAVLDKLQRKLHEASNTIDAVTARRRALDRRLRSVDALPEQEAQEVLGIAPDAAADAAPEDGDA